MLKNFILISIRNLKKSWILSLINILGLAVGIGCAILITLHVIDELGYESSHDKADRIFRIVQEEYIGSPGPLAAALRQRLPEIEDTVIVENYTRRSKKLFSTRDKLFYEDRVLLAEASLFEVFSFPLVKGNPKTALDNPNSLLLTETTARRYFGDENPIGKTITLENTWDLTVTGILEDIPEGTHLKFDLLAPFPFTLDEKHPGQEAYQRWGQANYVTYFLLSKGVPFERTTLEEKINRVKNESGGKQYNRLYSIQSIKNIHLASNLRSEFEANSSTRSVVFYAVIGVIILLIAWINSMNISTARSIKRAKEVGIRKVVGANRSQLVIQFFGESFLISLVSLAMAVILSSCLFPSSIQHSRQEHLGLRFSSPNSGYPFPCNRHHGSRIRDLSGRYSIQFRARQSYSNHSGIQVGREDDEADVRPRSVFPVHYIHLLHVRCLESAEFCEEEEPGDEQGACDQHRSSQGGTG